VPQLARASNRATVPLMLLSTSRNRLRIAASRPSTVSMRSRHSAAIPCGHKGEQSQAPKQALGFATLHPICEEWHVVVPAPALQVVRTGP